MAYSKKIYTGDGVTKLFTVTFPYIDPSHVTATVNGTAVPYTFQSKYVIEFATAPGAGAIIQLSRNSNPESRLVDFQDDSMGTEALFNLNSDQLLFLTQEALDKTLEGSVIEQVQDIADAALASALSAASAAEAAQDAAESITYPIPVASGGTGSTTASEARTALGLGSASTKEVGVAVGTIPEIQTGGKLLPSIIPETKGLLIQDITTVLNTVATGSGVIPIDDTIPQITEGFQVLSGTITPTSVGNKIVIEAAIPASPSTTTTPIAALFVGGASSAVHVDSQSLPTGYTGVFRLRFEFISTGTAPVDISVRIGCAAGTLTINGAGSVRLFGGAFNTRLRIMEIKE